MRQKEWHKVSGTTYSWEDKAEKQNAKSIEESIAGDLWHLSHQAKYIILLCGGMDREWGEGRTDPSKWGMLSAQHDSTNRSGDETKWDKSITAQQQSGKTRNIRQPLINMIIIITQTLQKNNRIGDHNNVWRWSICIAQEAVCTGVTQIDTSRWTWTYKPCGWSE